eukprot:jgi/Botrbrau1/8222/Bobra.0392s0018.1
METQTGYCILPVEGVLTEFQLPPRIHLHKSAGVQKYTKQQKSPGSPPANVPRKGVAWTDEEHAQFLKGLKHYGRGKWREISRDFCPTRNATQVASHAQKYHIRLEKGTSGKRRSRFTDIEEELSGEGEAAGPESSIARAQGLLGVQGVRPFYSPTGAFGRTVGYPVGKVSTPAVPLPSHLSHLPATRTSPTPGAVLLTVEPLDLTSSHRDSSRSPQSSGGMSPCDDCSVLRPTAEHNPFRIDTLLRHGYIYPTTHSEQNDIKLSDPSAFTPYSVRNTFNKFDFLLSAMQAAQTASSQRSGLGHCTNFLDFKGVSSELFVKANRAVS